MAEELILPVVIAIYKRMIDDSVAKQVSSIPLLNNTIQKIISDSLW